MYQLFQLGLSNCCFHCLKPFFGCLQLDLITPYWELIGICCIWLDCQLLNLSSIISTSGFSQIYSKFYSIFSWIYTHPFQHPYFGSCLQSCQHLVLLSFSQQYLLKSVNLFLEFVSTFSSSFFFFFFFFLCVFLGWRFVVF